MTAPTEPIRLEILIDPVCPWCYIGKANLERALEARPLHRFALTWHPFMLNPDMPPEGMDRREFFQARFGSPERVAQLHVPIAEAAEKAGIVIAHEKITRMPSTLGAHRLIHWAGIEGRQTPVVAALFKAYWVEGRDIGDPAVLAAIAGEQGLDGAAIARLLASEADAEEIRHADRTARARGIGGVPAFIIGGQYAVSGAQPREFWLDVIDELAEQQTGSDSGQQAGQA